MRNKAAPLRIYVLLLVALPLLCPCSPDSAFAYLFNALPLPIIALLSQSIALRHGASHLLCYEVPRHAKPSQICAKRCYSVASPLLLYAVLRVSVQCHGLSLPRFSAPLLFQALLLPCVTVHCASTPCLAKSSLKTMCYASNLGLNFVKYHVNSSRNSSIHSNDMSLDENNTSNVEATSRVSTQPTPIKGNLSFLKMFLGRHQM